MIDSQMKFVVESPQYRPRILQFRATTGAAQVETITMPATAAATQADFVVIYNTDGTTEALWLDIDADGTEPTADEYLNADIQTIVSISTGDDAADNAVIFAAAVTIADVTVLDNLDGTVTLTQDVFLACADAVPYNEDASGAGSIGVAVVTNGVTPILGNGKFDASIVQSATGTYVITFNENFLRAPEAGVLSITDNRVPRITAVDSFSITIETQNLSGGAAANGSFSCLVLGSDSPEALLQY